MVVFVFPQDLHGRNEWREYMSVCWGLVRLCPVLVACFIGSCCNISKGHGDLIWTCMVDVIICKCVHRVSDVGGNGGADCLWEILSGRVQYKPGFCAWFCNSVLFLAHAVMAQRAWEVGWDRDGTGAYFYGYRALEPGGPLLGMQSHMNRLDGESSHDG